MPRDTGAEPAGEFALEVGPGRAADLPPVQQAALLERDRQQHRDGRAARHPGRKQGERWADGGPDEEFWGQGTVPPSLMISASSSAMRAFCARSRASISAFSFSI